MYSHSPRQAHSISMDRRFTRESAAEHGAFARLAFSQFRDGLYRFLRRKLRNAESAEDLMQEVYLRLLRTADRKMVKNPQAYVFGVAFNVLYEFKLHEERSPVDFDSEAVAELGTVLAGEADDPEDVHERRARTQWLESVMARLSPMQQAVLLMAKRQGLAHAQIAEKLGISIGTVRKHLARAVDQCRRAMDE